MYLVAPNPLNWISIITKPSRPLTSKTPTPSDLRTQGVDRNHLLPPPSDPVSLEQVSLSSLSSYLRNLNYSSVSGITVRISTSSVVKGRKSRPATQLRPGVGTVLRATIPGLMRAAIRIAPPPSLNSPLRIMTVTCAGFDEAVHTLISSNISKYSLSMLPPTETHAQHIRFFSLSSYFAAFCPCPFATKCYVSAALNGLFSCFYHDALHSNALDLPSQDMFASYSSLYRENCSACGVLLSRIGKTPPVARIWSRGGDDDNGIGVPRRWMARHLECINTR
jgi:hypothetical protein